jgi:hypothetical protein
MMRAIPILFCLLFAGGLAPLPIGLAFAQNTQVTGTFKTEDHKSPSAAGLAVLGCIDAAQTPPICTGSAPYYGTVVFRSVDALKRPSALRCGTTYPPQRVPGYLQAEGTLADSAGAAGVRLVPTAGCEPAGLQYEAEITLAGSADGRRPEVRLKQYKSVPNQATADWSAL